jgi:hypothetical protein
MTANIKAYHCIINIKLLIFDQTKVISNCRSKKGGENS